MRKRASRRTLGSNLARVDAHAIKPAEYKELPELTDEMLARAVVKRGELLDVHVSSVVRRSLDDAPVLNPSPWRGEGQGRG